MSCMGWLVGQAPSSGIGLPLSAGRAGLAEAVAASPLCDEKRFQLWDLLRARSELNTRKAESRNRKSTEIRAGRQRRHKLD